MAPTPPGVQWDHGVQHNPDFPKLPKDFYRLWYNGHALMFTSKVIGQGTQPPPGIKSCPLWICLHGGGTTSARNDNDDSWARGRDYFEGMVKEYAESQGPVITVCPRGVSSTEREKKSSGEIVPAKDE